MKDNLTGGFFLFIIFFSLLFLFVYSITYPRSVRQFQFKNNQIRNKLQHKTEFEVGRNGQNFFALQRIPECNYSSTKKFNKHFK